MQKITAILVTVGAFILGLHEGDCTGAIVLGMLMVSVMFDRNKKSLTVGAVQAKNKANNLCLHNTTKECECQYDAS